MKYFQLKTTQAGLKLYFLDGIIKTGSENEKQRLKKAFDGLKIPIGQKGSKAMARHCFWALEKYRGMILGRSDLGVNKNG